MVEREPSWSIVLTLAVRYKYRFELALTITGFGVMSGPGSDLEGFFKN